MRWSRFWQRQRRDADLARELDAYLDEEVARQVADGTPVGEARAAARRKLGNVTRVREAVYERNSVVALETWWRDVVYAVRLLRRNRGFTAVALFSIALGIGANASVFTLLDQAILRPLPVLRPSELTLVTSRGYHYGNGWGEGNELSYPMYADLRDHNDVFAGMLCRFNFMLDVTADGVGERLTAELGSGRYFPGLGGAGSAAAAIPHREPRRSSCSDAATGTSAFTATPGSSIERCVSTTRC